MPRSFTRCPSMRVLELSTLALTVLAGGMPLLLACASAPPPPAPRAAAGPAPAAVPAGPGPNAAAAAIPADADPHSFSRPSEVAVEHLVLDLTVDFHTRPLSGRVSLRLHHKRR